MTFSIVYWNTWDDGLMFSMQGEDKLEHNDGKTCHVFIS